MRVVLGAVLGAVIGSLVGGLIAAYLVTHEEPMMMVLTGFVAAGTVLLAAIAFLQLRIMYRIQWFTGAQERHSDQMRQLAAKKAEIKMIWWDKTEDEADGTFPFTGRHGQENELQVLHIGIPPRHRKVQPTAWERFWGIG